MPKKLKYILKNKKKVYTLKEGKDAHYKFVHPLVKDAPKNGTSKK